MTASLAIAFFGHDADESTVIKRATAFQRAGCAVHGFMFRRPREGLHRTHAWPVVHLGTTQDRSYFRRIPVLLSGVGRALRQAARLRRSDVIYARNFDMLAVAMAAKVLSRSNAAVVYEVLDIQRPLLRRDGVGRVLRWVERRLLGACALLVVSSPAFMTAYFTPLQGRRSGWFLLENKVPPSSKRRGGASRDLGPPWVIGWFGTLRCRRSFAMLRELASTLGDSVRIHLAGRPSPTDIGLDEIEAATRQRGNLVYLGGYDHPDALAALYAPVHFSWCIDFTDAGSNSDWLLPNRVYEGGLHGAVALARAGTATGRHVTRLGLGLAFDDQAAPAIAAYLGTLEVEAYQQVQQSVAAADEATFVDLGDTDRLVTTLRTLNSRDARVTSLTPGPVR